MVSKTTWTNNSVAIPFDYNTSKRAVVWISVAFGVFVIIHSAYIHGYKRHKIRNITETGAILLILTSLCLDYAGTNPTDSFIIAFFQGSLSYGILSCGIQVLDNYFVFILYKLLVELPSSLKILTQSYIWLTFFVYVPLVTVFPIYWDFNYEPFSQIYYVVGYYVWSGMYISYNIFFGWNIYYLMHKRYSAAEIAELRQSKVIMVSFRNIYHLLLR